MTSARATLRHVPTNVLEQLRDGVATGALKTPIERSALIAYGLRHQLDELELALAGHRSAACLTILDVTLAERAAVRPPPELVWTGPEGPTGLARDTAVVVQALFESATESVILAGYSFDHARDVLAPLHAVMRERGATARFFVDIPQRTPAFTREEHVIEHLGAFMARNWPFGDPRPRVFYDLRALEPGPPWCSLHAKCVVVDDRRAFVSSANFTQRGQERNIEVGVRIDDPTFASFLASQWMGLIDAGLVAEHVF